LRIFRAGLIVSVLAVAAGCSDPPITPDPIPDAPTLTCPATVQAVTVGSPVPIFFTVPAAVGGQTPVPVTCSVAPGTAFPLGSTAVSCTATDSLNRTASCNFTVTVSAVPRISKTKFLAFGDSLTFGRCGAAPTVCTGGYIPRLDELLLTRYWRQSFTFNNAGVPGERAATGEARLGSELSRYNPEVLLLMHGTNDLLASPATSAQALVSLENMVVMAQARGVTVFIATVPPIAPGGPSASSIPLVVPYNNGIKAIAARRGVQVVDIYTPLNADTARYYSGNDVHPLAEGYKVMGETWYAAISAALENTPTSAMSRR
jgi:lysophospholipase L1-like esterase